MPFGKAKKPSAVTVNVTCTVVQVGEGYLAFAVVSGVRVAGGRRASAYDALGSLFQVLAGQSGDNSAVAIALEMLLAGFSMDDIPELGTGS